MMGTVIRNINRILQKFIGIKIIRFPDKESQRYIQLINYYQINKIFDVGANTGNFSQHLRDIGYRGDIVAFEPLASAYKIMKKKADGDKNWIPVHAALGNEDGEGEINIAGNSESSSILNMKEAHLKSAPESVYIGKEKIKLQKLDTVFASYCNEKDNILLKLDTQGFEKQVLEGATNSLSKIKAVQLEMSLVPLYDGELLFFDMVDYMKQKGFTLYGLEHVFSDPNTSQLLQVDGIFVKE